ncbi:transporter substrate-binding domain-containing protein [Legionella oakridgensis]|uniref:ABC-type amino acid transport/signal transduction systems, periplasmic component/domain protein n=2 Tax=Legionella oakridgensis TaxID=29423 RepID=W0BD09_9GAMM|nr:transporter substrate-binding domain-containing protein [Legionella oakridgensis]AHE66586.1 ABC-type amino acid transport/signal transduction systems, periplasmic component/domain protein [Legionella oakridgensis ATCC 33761 = DSM 21215]KTD37813.1 arginine ABC transporter substrate-binding protein [Legionella oakridgensis]STY19734.1 arginine ABC transporter substrate-binding protein [Legionella longbeachae]
MKRIYYGLIILLIILCSSAFAQNPPLRVAVTNFAPPYVMQGGHKQIFGFDITMMEEICSRLQRTCQFNSMMFEQLLPTLVADKADVAIGAITITPERAKIVNFSLPYLPSQAKFLTNEDYFNKPFDLSVVEGKRIAVETGTVFPAVIKRMGIKNPKIVEFSREEDLIEALSLKKIDFALLDTPTATYWEIRSAGLLKTVGESKEYGFGLGIAVNPNNMALVQAINQALLQYQKSPTFHANYTTYFGNL